MALADRLLGVNGAQKIEVHAFQSIVAEWARGQITGAQAQAAIQVVGGGVVLTAGEVTEAQNLVNTVPTGATTANQAARALRLLEIEQILNMADRLVPPYDTPAALKTRLGF